MLKRIDPMTRKHITFAILAGTLFILFGFTLWREENPEWKKYQVVYYQKLAEKTGRPELANTPLKIQQIWRESLDRTDRCTTCHLGIDKENFIDEPQPYTAHPDLAFYQKNHPFEKFGCTICHEGDGRATVYYRTHGAVEHLERQLLKDEYVQTSCTKCHSEVYILEGSFPAAPAQIEGKRLVGEKACGACHTIRQLGTSGTIGPELSAFGSKTELAFNLTHDFHYVTKARIYEEHIMADWVIEHFLDPQRIVPGNPILNIPPTVMPNLGFSEEEAKVLTIFVMGLKDLEVEKIPSEYLPATARIYRTAP